MMSPPSVASFSLSSTFASGRPPVGHQPFAGEGPSRIPAVGDLILLGAVEGAHIRGILTISASLEEAAKVLGLEMATLYRRRKKLGM